MLGSSSSSSWSWSSSVVVGVAEDEVAVERVAVGVDHLDVVEQPVEGLGLADLGDQLGHEVVLLVGLADLVRLLLELHGHPLVLGGEVALVGVDALGGGDGAQREVDLDGLLGRALHALDEAGLASWPVTDSHCSMLMPCDCSWRTVPSTRRCRSLCTSGSGGSMSVSPVSASVTRPTSSWRAWLSFDV